MGRSALGSRGVRETSQVAVCVDRAVRWTNRGAEFGGDVDWVWRQPRAPFRGLQLRHLLRRHQGPDVVGSTGVPGVGRDRLRELHAGEELPIGAGVGGPDLLPHRWFQRQNSPPLITHRAPGTVAGVAVQDGNLEDTNPATSERVTVEKLFEFEKLTKMSHINEFDCV